MSVLGAAEITWGVRAFALCIVSTILTPLLVLFNGAEGWKNLPRSARFGIALFVIVCFVQLVPLPPGVWSQLPGGESRNRVLAQLGMADLWMPLTLTPSASIFGTLMSLIAAIVICSLTNLSNREFRILTGIVVVLIVLGIAIGIVQVASAGLVFRFYDATDAGALVGFYANKNHMALAMICSIAMTFYLAKSEKVQQRRAQFAFIGYWIFVALCLPVTNSRAGLILGVVISGIILWNLLNEIESKRKLIYLFSILIIVPIFLFAPIPKEFLSRFDAVADDLRWPMLQHSMVVWKQFWVFGSGLGSFADVYATLERREWLFPTYVNNVHNDYIQLWIETGVAGIISLVFLATGIYFSLNHSFRHLDARHRTSSVMGFCIVLAFALHSVVDYPLRRPAALVIFVLGLSAVFRGAHDKNQQAEIQGNVKIKEVKIRSRSRIVAGHIWSRRTKAARLMSD